MSDHDAIVTVSADLERLVVVARGDGDAGRLVGPLQTALPDVRVKRGGGGVVVPLLQADRLLAADTGLRLRWDEVADIAVRNRARAKAVLPGLRADLRALIEGGPDVARDRLQDVPGLGVLDGHQLVNVAVMTAPNGLGACVFDEQGAGKTVTGIFAFDVLVSRDEADFLVVVAPKSMIAEWGKDFHRFKHDLYRTVTVTGSRRAKLNALSTRAEVFVTNYETVVSMEAELRALFRRGGGRGVLMVDESFYVKNEDAQRTGAIRRLREWCTRAFVLCGTPAPNAPGDLVQQFTVVDFGLTFAGVEIPSDRDAAVPVVQHAVEERGVYVRHLKRDVLPNLPGKTFNSVLVPMQPIQDRLYRAALQDLLLDLRATGEPEFRNRITSFLARRSALLQICSNPAAVAPGYAETPGKLVALDALLANLIEERGEKVVLWSFYTASIDALVARYARYGVTRYDGTVADVAERREAVRAFQEADAPRVFVANPAAAGAGLTLHRSRVAVYESMSNQAAHYLQSLDRVHRRGQERAVEYFVLLCDGSIELQEFERLRRKEAAAQHLLGDVVDPVVTRDVMLHEIEQAVALLDAPGGRDAG